MKVKRITVGIRPLEKSLEEFAATAAAVQAGKTVRPRRGVYFVNLEAMRRVLTDRRLRLLRLIRLHRPASILKLARLAGRDFKNVHNDLRRLADLGLVQLKSGHGAQGRVVPTVAYERIQLDIAV